jgi:hypothetical protein
MNGDLRYVPFGALILRVQLRAEMTHNFTKSPLTTERACRVPRSQLLRETTGPTLQSSKTSGGLTTSWDDPKTARATVSPTFHTHTGERLLNSRSASSQEPGRSLRLTFGYLTYIPVGMLAGRNGPKRKATRLRDSERTRER